ncbi:uncharacterized protein EV420DRAFT_1586803 [Desarmillaria tabescens]|uniref:Uncharacterized protein n=1 Tax=Armillaria tabescens TaxID=1929756 RepID=A0AA39JA15_ARMTA|nr:uncharacterized protein EV420DRAFT_1586803 [Desarmillaria tabescens]KAK0437981.1 hypothetical protein EV420DRAFT_1586803 [Desarmillaria tabescens]
MTSFLGLPVPLPASSTSEKTKGKERQKRCIVISSFYQTSLASELCFHLSHIYHSRLIWIGIGLDECFRLVHGIPIHARYDRFLVNVNPRHCQRCAGRTRMNVYISVVLHHSKVFNLTLVQLRGAGVPEYFFSTMVYSGSYHESVCHGVRHFRHTVYIHEKQLGSWDSRNINQPADLIDRWRFKRTQASLPARFSKTKDREALRSTFLDTSELNKDIYDILCIIPRKG